MKTVSLTIKKTSKNHSCFILRRFGLFFIHLQSKKYKTTLGNVSVFSGDKTVKSIPVLCSKLKQKQ